VYNVSKMNSVDRGDVEKTNATWSLETGRDLCVTIGDLAGIMARKVWFDHEARRLLSDDSLHMISELNARIEGSGVESLSDKVNLLVGGRGYSDEEQKRLDGAIKQVEASLVNLTGVIWNTSDRWPEVLELPKPVVGESGQESERSQARRIPVAIERVTE
jgi:hypothetical protein